MSPEEAAGARLQLFNLYMRTRLPAKALEQVEAYLEEFPDHPNHDAMKERADSSENRFRIELHRFAMTPSGGLLCPLESFPTT